jgi:hypothetical protein
MCYDGPEMTSRLHQIIHFTMKSDISLRDSLAGNNNSVLKVLVIGGSYGGLAAALNLLDLCQGRPCRFSPEVIPEYRPVIPIQITIVDQRDGFCMYVLREGRRTG